MIPAKPRIGIAWKLTFTLICSECFVTSLKYNSYLNHSLTVENSISSFFSLFYSFTSLCVISHDDDLILIFNKLNRLKFSVTYFVEFDQASLLKCESVVMSNVKQCYDVNKLHCENHDFPIYFLYDYLPSNLTDLESCLNNSISSEVVVVSVLQFSIFELSSVFSFPRSFKKSTVDRVREHRVKRVREDLGGIQIIGAFMYYPPFVIVTDGEEKPDTFDGMEIKWFQHLSQQLNFTLRYLMYNNWGVLDSDGVWQSGVGQAMQQGKVQLAVANIWQFSTLYKIMDFGPAITQAKLGFIVRRPEQIDFDWRTLISVFEPGVWCVISLLFAVTSVVYWLGITRGTPFYHEVCMSKDCKGSKYRKASSGLFGGLDLCQPWFSLHYMFYIDWTCSFVTVLGHFTMSTSHSYRSRDNLSRYILTCWSIFSLLLTALLSSGIYCRLYKLCVLSLTLPLYSSRVDTLRQLVEGDYYWTAQYYLRLNNEEIRQSMFNFQNRWNCLYEKNYRYLERQEVETRMYFDEKITFLVQIYGDDLVILDTEGLHGHEALSEFRVVEEVASETHISFGARKNSPLLKPLAKMTIRFMELGLLEQWKTSVMRRWPTYDTRHLLVEQDDPSFDEPESLLLKKMQPVFYLLIVGLTSSTVIFFLEMIWYFS